MHGDDERIPLASFDKAWCAGEDRFGICSSALEKKRFKSRKPEKTVAFHAFRAE